MSKLVYIVCDTDKIAKELIDAITGGDYAIHKRCPPTRHGAGCPTFPHELEGVAEKCHWCWKQWVEENVEVVTNEQDMGDR